MQPLGHHLLEQLLASPERVVATYVALDGSARDVTARELALHANTVALELRRLGLAERALVAIVHRSGPWLHAAWIGALWAGHVPTMIAPPSPRMAARKYACRPARRS
jgi:acyl-CoA synthetase (AMP-forming)/AMP-acid ligase II